MLSLLSRLERAADSGGTVTFVSGDTSIAVPWSQLHDEARASAAALQHRGIGPGRHVAILAPTTRALVTAIQATWLAGATIVVLPLPMRLASIEEFIAQTRERVRRADTDLLLIDPDLAPYLESRPGDPPSLVLTELIEVGTRLGAGAYQRPADDLDALAILQFTSGSTSEPKGVMLPQRVLGANLDACIEAGQLQDDDVFVSWLPLYHDMGLVGMLSIPMTTGRDLVLGAPQDFLGSPARWMRWISDHRGTVTAGPNFSWVLATRALRRATDLDLSSLRIALNGAEPVDPRTVEAFVEAGAPFGLRPGAIFPAFGMAELAIGGTFPEPMRGLRTDAVDRRVLESERYAAPAEPAAEGTREFALLGRPLPGLEIRIADPDSGRPLAEREVGELEIRGTSVTPGYYRNPEATAAMFRDGWLRTGDLGYLVGGELVLCGRIKDVIIIGGRNIFPEDVERAVAEIDGVRAGNVIAFGVEGAKGKEQMVVVAESRADDPDGLRRLVHHRAMEVVGAPPHDIVLVTPGTLPKTSSGKLQRSLCRAKYLSRELQPVH
ncbi:AMP-binding protein [Rhabdothermincola sediminis]|uniref:AMP-binding protein n=1 Tax=Rhabdothermincola sediminis TaxID=2751370 RepID=UPI001AA063B6|nr:AMP-binding protein [Rhabdothermincola sediminis]